jgi:hypothetical protein
MTSPIDKLPAPLLADAINAAVERMKTSPSGVPGDGK